MRDIIPVVLFIDAPNQCRQQDSTTIVIRPETDEGPEAFDARVRKEARDQARRTGAEVHLMESSGTFAVPVYYAPTESF